MSLFLGVLLVGLFVVGGKKAVLKSIVHVVRAYTVRCPMQSYAVRCTAEFVCFVLMRSQCAIWFCSGYDTLVA